MKSTYNKTDRYSNQGFTLIELGVVLMIMGMMATSVVPTLIAQTRDKLADRVVRDFQHLNNAVLLFRADQAPNRWPGYNPDCSNAGTDWFGELEDAGYIPDIDTAPTNPWGGDYHFTVDAVTCEATIRSDADTIPESVHTYIQNTSSVGMVCQNAAPNNCRYTVGGGGAGPGGGANLEAFEGQISIFDADANLGNCPDDWILYTPLDGRFPRGDSGNTGTTLLPIQGQSTLGANLNYTWGGTMTGTTFTSSLEDDINVPANATNAQMVALRDNRLLQDFQLEIVQDEGGVTVNTDELGLLDATDWNYTTDGQSYNEWFAINPPYTNVLYCKYNPIP